ncbi:MAG: DUF4230 domain-containing protein [Planctomycetota bacterium]|nr:DUF4230 domain-containing protein [Planctomycetota bacterium]
MTESPPPPVPASPSAPAPAPPPRGPSRWGCILAILLALLLVVLIIAGGIVLTVVQAAKSATNLLGVTHSDRAMVEILRSEEMMFLVTDRIVTRVDVEINEQSLWAGGRQGLLLATARLYAGIDLRKLSEKSVHEEGDVVVVEVPRPGLLDFAIDTDWKFFDKRTGAWMLADWAAGRDFETELRTQLRYRTLEFVKKNELLPDPKRTLDRLNRYAGGLTPRVGKRVEFRYIGDPPPPRPPSKTDGP